MFREIFGRLWGDASRNEIPKIWGGVANHSGDSYFDFVYLSEWPSVRHLSRYEKAGKSPSLSQKSAKGIDDGRVKRFLKTFGPGAMKQKRPSPAKRL